MVGSSLKRSERLSGGGKSLGDPGVRTSCSRYERGGNERDDCEPPRPHQIVLNCSNGWRQSSQ